MNLSDRIVALHHPISYGIAGLLALLIAWIHLLHPQYGIGRLFLYLELGTIYDPRPPLFVASAFGIVMGIVVWHWTDRRDLLYAAGIVLMLVYLFGYFAWHTVLDHGAFWPYIEAHSHHDVGLFETIIAHLRADRLALVSKLAELIVLTLLTAFFIGERWQDISVE